jgi:hypothetical protein
MVFNATFNNISVISWRSSFFIGGGNWSIRRKHWPVASHWYRVHGTLCLLKRINWPSFKYWDQNSDNFLIWLLPFGDVFYIMMDIKPDLYLEKNKLSKNWFPFSWSIRRKHWPVASHWYRVHGTLCLSRVQTHNVSGDILTVIEAPANLRYS